MQGKKIDEGKDGLKPEELGGKRRVRAAAVETSETRVAIEEPIQCRVESGGDKRGRGTKEQEMLDKLGKRVGDKEGVGKSSFAERGSGVGRGLNNNGGDGKEGRVSSKCKRNGTKLRGKGQPSDGAVREEEMAASAGGGRRFGHRVITRRAGRRTETKG